MKKFHYFLGNPYKNSPEDCFKELHTPVVWVAVNVSIKNSL